MKQISKLLIAYDGSPCSDAALYDLRYAGLPATLEAVVVTVAFVFLPPEVGAPDDLLSPSLAEMVRPAQAHAEDAVRQALEIAELGAQRARSDFPGWTVRSEADGDSPAWGVIKLADRFAVDLIVLGSHGHSSVGGRLILGSVSQRVLYEAECSVRVARCSAQPDGPRPVRIVIGFDGSESAKASADVIASRVWPEGSEVRVIVTDNSLMPAIGSVVAKVRSAGLSISEVYSDSDPATALLKEAEEWRADSIFLGASDVHGIQHILRGSVSSAVAANARCSVEVVRRLREDLENNLLRSPMHVG